MDEVATPVKKIRKNTVSNVEICSPGDLNRLELKNILILNPTFANSLKIMKEKDLKKLKKRKEYRVLSENNLLKEIKNKEKALKRKLYQELCKW